jgi:hypothetical protein
MPLLAAVVLFLAAVSTGRATPITASSVVSYNAGSGVDPSFQYAAAALGNLNGDDGVYPGWGEQGAINPFNPTDLGYNPAQPAAAVVIIGGGGQLTLALSGPVAANGRTLGVYSNVGYTDNSSDGSGLTDGGPGQVNTPDVAVVSVSQDGVHFVTLNGGQPITFSVATNYYLDTEISEYYQPLGSQAASQSKPFLGAASSLANMTYDQIRTAFNSSAGGQWLDLSGTGLPQVNYVRFTVPTGDQMAVDAIGGLGVAQPVTPGSRIISESVGTGSNTSYIVVDFGPQSFEFAVNYDGTITGEQALQLLQADSDFRLTTQHFGSGDMVTGLDYGGYVQTGNGAGGTAYWNYFTGDGTTWTRSGMGFGTRDLSNGSYDGWMWNTTTSSGPDFVTAAPEPASLVLLGLGSICLLRRRRS